MRLARRLLLALWAGMLVSVGALAAPVLFATLADRHLAGTLAGALFRVVTVASAAIAALLAWIGTRRIEGAARLAAALGPARLRSAREWGVRPFIEAARAAGATGGLAFGAWHGLATLLYWTAAAWVGRELVRELAP